MFFVPEDNFSIGRDSSLTALLPAIIIKHTLYSIIMEAEDELLKMCHGLRGIVEVGVGVSVRRDLAALLEHGENMLVGEGVDRETRLGFYRGTRDLIDDVYLLRRDFRVVMCRRIRRLSHQCRQECEEAVLLKASEEGRTPDGSLAYTPWVGAHPYFVDAP